MTSTSGLTRANRRRLRVPARVCAGQRVAGWRIDTPRHGENHQLWPPQRAEASRNPTRGRASRGQRKGHGGGSLAPARACLGPEPAPISRRSLGSRNCHRRGSQLSRSGACQRSGSAPAPRRCALDRHTPVARVGPTRRWRDHRHGQVPPGPEPRPRYVGPGPGSRRRRAHHQRQREVCDAYYQEYQPT